MAGQMYALCRNSGCVHAAGLCSSAACSTQRRICTHFTSTVYACDCPPGSNLIILLLVLNTPFFARKTVDLHCICDSPTQTRTELLAATAKRSGGGKSSNGHSSNGHANGYSNGYGNGFGNGHTQHSGIVVSNDVLTLKVSSCSAYRSNCQVLILEVLCSDSCRCVHSSAALLCIAASAFGCTA
jgi:hypothetical protein